MQILKSAAIKGQDKNILFIIATSLFSGILLLFLIRTWEIRVVYSVILQGLILLTLTTVVFQVKRITINLSRLTGIGFIEKLGNKKLYFAYGIAVLSSIQIIILSNYGINISNQPIIAEISKASPYLFVKLFALFYLLTLFPGIIIERTFLKKFNFLVIERFALMLLLSYCYITILGLSLISLGIYTTENFLAIFWIVLLGMESIKLLSARNASAKKIHNGMVAGVNSSKNDNCTVPLLFTKEKSEETTIGISMPVLIVIFSALSLASLSYMSVIGEAPYAASTSGDVYDYSVSGNMVDLGPYARAPYVWYGAFLWIVASLGHLPMYHTYALLSYYVAIMPIAFFSLARFILRDKRDIAALSTAFLYFGAGITMFLLISQSMTSNYSYFSGSIQSALDMFFSKAGGSGFSPLLFAPNTFDYGLVFFAIVFSVIAYEAKKTKNTKLVSIIISSLFASSAFYTHSINFLLTFFGMLLTVAVIKKELAKNSLVILGLTLGITLMLDPVSKMFLSGYLLGRTPSDFYIILLLAGSYLGALLLRKYGRISMRLPILRKRKKIEELLILSTSTILLISSFVFIQSNEPYVNIWTNSSTFLSPFSIIFRNYGFLLMAGLPAIPYFFVNSRRHILLIPLFIGIMLGIILSLVDPQLFLPSIFFTRYSAYLTLPLAILSAYYIFRLCRTFLKNHYNKNSPSLIRYLVVTFIIAILFTGVLSQAYARESFYVNRERTSMPDQLPQAIEWLNKSVPKQSTILAFSSDKLLSGLGNGFKVIPITHVYAKDWLSESWLKDIFFYTNSTQLVVYALNKLKVDYIFIEKNPDITLLTASKALPNVLESLPVIFENSQAKILEVPKSDISREFAIDDALFRYIVPSQTGMLLSKDLHGTFLFYSDLLITGEVTVGSKKITISDVKHNPLHVEGNVKIMSNGVPIRILVNSMGNESIVKVINGTISVQSAKVIPSNDSWGKVHSSDMLDDVSPYINKSVELLAVNPTLHLNGSLQSRANGVVPLSGEIFYTPYAEALNITGDYELEVQYASGIIISKIKNANDISIKKMNANLYWGFDEGTSIVAKDSSGNGVDGIIHGAVFTEGKKGKGLNFDGVDDYVSIGVDRLEWINGGSLTLTAWFKSVVNPTHSAAKLILSIEGFYFIGLQANDETTPGGIKGTVTGSSSTAIKGTKDLRDDKWHFAALTYDGKTQKLYLDAALIGSSGVSAADITSVDRNTKIGANFDGKQQFHGKIDEVQIYNKALSEQEIRELFNSIQSLKN